MMSGRRRLIFCGVQGTDAGSRLTYPKKVYTWLDEASSRKRTRILEIAHNANDMVIIAALSGSERSSAWLEHLLWEQDVAGSNPVAPTILFSCHICRGTYILTGMEQSQFMQYVPVLMLAVLAVAFSFGMLIMSVVVGKKGKRLPIKDTAYECGMLPIGEGNARLSVKFYLVAMLFILFDIEVVFLYPWAVVYREMLKTNAESDFRLHAFFPRYSVRRLHLRAQEERVRLEELNSLGRASSGECKPGEVFSLMSTTDQIRHQRLARLHCPRFHVRQRAARHQGDRGSTSN